MSRQTDQRHAIRAAIDRARGPMTAAEVLDSAQIEVPGLGIATVYRAIRGLLDEGWLVAVDLPGEPSRYERGDKAHHHHFECRACGKVYDIPGCAHGLEAHGLERQVPGGFVVERHEVLLFGRCAACAA